ncbi:hypothetical protein GF318_03755 [Candidatus Micrarchaeota archaeon]|nr:hypothetical protein [Candidatus Micrarchaeota archaeon]
MKSKILFSVLLLFSAAFAWSTDTYFTYPLVSGYYVDSDLTLTTDFTLSLVSGEVAEGNPSNLQTGDVVCSGAVLRATPTYNAKWATSDFSAKSLYPSCAAIYCPSMISGGPVQNDNDVSWLSSTVFNEHDEWGDDYGLLFGWDAVSQNMYDDLTPLVNQPVTYKNVTGEYPDKRAGVGIYCKGDMEIVDGTSVKSSNEMPSTGSADFAVTSTGTHGISTRLSDTECIAAIVKHPLDISSHPGFFRLYYFSTGQPSIPSAVGTETISITVQESGGACNFHETDVEASSSLSDEDLIMIKVTFENGGDPIQITDVSSSSADFTVSEFPTLLCDILGFPPSFCPASNGFDEDVSSGGTHDVYVLVERNVGASGGTVLTFDAQTVSGSCGGAATCSEDVDLGDSVPILCEIDPDELTYGTLEVAEFLVYCENLAGDGISCVGDDWYFNDGISGGFVEKDNTHAWAYPTSSPGSSGTLNYESGIAHCLSDIDVVSPGDSPGDYECELVPSSAELETGDTQAFVLNCFHEGSASEPDSVDYDLIDGVDGSLSGESTSGVDFEAGSDSTGQLRAFAYWSIPGDDPIMGAVALADITIGAGGNETNETGGDDDDYYDDGSSMHCKIGGGPLNPFPGSSGWLTVMCGPDYDIPCATADWDAEPPGIASVSGDENGASYTINGEPQESGKIWATVTYDGESGDCFLPFQIGLPDCWEFT